MMMGFYSAPLSFSLACIFLWKSPVCVLGARTRLDRLNYKDFPTRTPESAAVIEWGHSAIISALDASVAQFGPQTSVGAYFEVEAMPILADPIDGNIPGEGGGVLRNADEVEGNLVVMTNSAGLTGVQMALIAKKSGAAALMVVNTDNENPDFIYSLQTKNEEEEKLAAEHIDIPVVMISLSSGNVLTSANVEVDENDSSITPANHGMPELVRLYATGGDRPFFEDLSNESPIVYLIHNLLTEEECQSLIASAEKKVEPYKGEVNLLEGTDELPEGTVKGMERTYLWKGMLKGPEAKDIEERMEQVTGFPRENFSDFQLNKFSQGGGIAPHFDRLPEDYGSQMVSMYMFLNDDYEGGEVVFHKANPPIKIKPRRGMAIVTHNDHGWDEESVRFDPSTGHAELSVSDGVKWTAKKWIYADPLHLGERIILPTVALPFGGKLPSAVRAFHDSLIESFGEGTGKKFFNKACVMIPVLIIFGIASIIENLMKKKRPKEVKKDKKKRRNKKDN